MIQTVSIGLVGAGYWGQKLLPKFIEAPGSSVRMICDIHPQNRGDIEKRFPGIPTTDSYDKLLGDRDVRAVVLATPLATHFPLAQKAIQAGKHVWIEKPLALCLDEGRRLVQFARAAGTILFVDHTFLYDPAVSLIHDLVKNGDFGDIYHVFLQRLNLGRIKRDSSVWWNSGPHDISIILYLLPGHITSIALHGYSYLQEKLQDLNMAAIELSGGTSAFVYHNWLYPENTAKLTMVGSKQLLVYEGKFDKRSIAVSEYAVEHGVPGQPLPHELPTTIPSRLIAGRKLEEFGSQEPLALAVEDFLESIRHGRAPRSDGDFSLRVLTVLDAGERSAQGGGTKIFLEV
ncbi:MAG TPA: Gfo/Idh/MocA family oxidoreductase [Candidatus Binatia bacterium]